MTEKRTDLVRLNVNMNRPTAAALESLMHAEDISATEAVRRAISVYTFFKEVQDHGGTVFIKENGYTQEIELL